MSLRLFCCWTIHFVNELNTSSCVYSVIDGDDINVFMFAGLRRVCHNKMIDGECLGLVYSCDDDNVVLIIFDNYYVLILGSLLISFSKYSSSVLNYCTKESIVFVLFHPIVLQILISNKFICKGMLGFCSWLIMWGIISWRG